VRCALDGWRIPLPPGSPTTPRGYRGRRRQPGPWGLRAVCPKKSVSSSQPHSSIKNAPGRQADSPRLEPRLPGHLPIRRSMNSEASRREILLRTIGCYLTMMDSMSKSSDSIPGTYDLLALVAEGVPPPLAVFSERGSLLLANRRFVQAIGVEPRPSESRSSI